MEDETKDNRPVMSRRDVSWHSVCAAMRARREAEQAGIDPVAKLALLGAAADEAGCGRMPAVTLGTLWALEETEGLMGELCGDSGYAEQGLVSLTLLDPERVLLALLAGDLEEVRMGMVETALVVTPARAEALDAHLTAEMRRLKHLAGGGATGPEKK